MAAILAILYSIEDRPNYTTMMQSRLAMQGNAGPTHLATAIKQQVGALDVPVYQIAYFVYVLNAAGKLHGSRHRRFRPAGF